MDAVTKQPTINQLHLLRKAQSMTLPTYLKSVLNLTRYFPISLITPRFTHLMEKIREVRQECLPEKNRFPAPALKLLKEIQEFIGGQVQAKKVFIKFLRQSKCQQAWFGDASPTHAKGTRPNEASATSLKEY